jgi:aspartyl protease family protein
MGLRLIVWLGLMVAIFAGVSMLTKLFPGRASSDLDEAYVLWNAALLALVSAGVVFGARYKAREAVRNIALWSGIALALLLGYAYQDELRDAGERLRAELVPGYAAVDTGGAVSLIAGEDGHFHVIGEANGVTTDFLIDTGASDIVLTPTDARRLGIDVGALDFSRRFQTANGVGRGASFTLTRLSVGSIVLTDVPVSINEADMRESLLGMSFLRRLASFEVVGRKLILHPR